MININVKLIKSEMTCHAEIHVPFNTLGTVGHAQVVPLLLPKVRQNWLIISILSYITL